jgi:hypothetical protein
MQFDHQGDYAKLESPTIRLLLRSPLVAVVMHWTFQSLFYMDPTERWFKITLDLVLTLLGGIVLCVWLHWQVAWLIAFVVAHTLNFLFNGQLWGVLKHYGMVSHTYEEFYRYVQGLGERMGRETALRYGVIYGSLSRRQWSPSSDLDARIVRYPGFVNGVRACGFLLRERSRALIARFPLDVYVLDSENALKKLCSDENAIRLDGSMPVFANCRVRELDL